MNMVKKLTKKNSFENTLTNHREKLEVGSIKRVNIISFKFVLFDTDVSTISWINFWILGMLYTAFYKYFFNFLYIFLLSTVNDYNWLFCNRPFIEKFWYNFTGLTG